MGSSRLRALAALAVIVTLLSPSVAPASGVTRPGAPTHLTVDGLAAPIGLGTGDVAFGWYLGDARPGAAQSAYRIRVSRPVLAGPDRGRSFRIWDSGRVRSDVQAFVPYAGPTLAPDTTYRWTVQTWDAGGVASPASAPATFDTGLGDGDWHADWIKRSTVEPPNSPTSAQVQDVFGVGQDEDEYSYVRKETHLAASPIVRARVYISADQQYELYVNGTPAGKGQAYSFPDAQYYETQDVTSLLRPGVANAFGIIYGWQGPGKGRPAGTPGVIARISVLHADGTTESIATDGSWRVLPGAWLPGTQRDEEGDPVDYTENIVGPAEPIGWDRPGFADVGWLAATVIGPHPVAPWTHLVSVRTRIVYAPVHPVSVTTLPSGAVVADFGAIFSAIPQVTFHQGIPGHLVTMHAGNLLDASGVVSTAHGTEHTDMSYSYVERGGTETFRPFDYLGFRYLQIDDPLSAIDVIALTRHAAVPNVDAGTFTSSNPTLDAVYRLAVHSALYTMQEQFVDTPLREKGSWLGDGRNESEAAMAALGDVNMTRKSLLEFAQSQARFWPDGAINKLYPTGIQPGEIPEGTEMYPDWVWQYWLRTGDRETLKTLLPVVEKVADFLWRSVDPSDGLITNLAGATDGSQYPTDMLLNTLGVNVFARVSDLEAALGRPHAAERHRAAVVTAGINAHLVDPDGIYYAGLDAHGRPIADGPSSLNAETRQSDNAYALMFGIVPRPRRGVVRAYVAGQHMATPPIFAGDLVQAIGLARDDRTVMDLLSNARQPGWANILARGGTFGWEVWNPVDNDVPVGGTPIGSFFGNGDSISHGFSANVLVAIQQSLLGVRPTTAGFGAFTVAPAPHVLAFASGTVPTPHGPISVSWRRAPSFALDITVPPNTTAAVRMPAAAVTVNGTAPLRVPGVRGAATHGQSTTVTLGGGRYRLRVAGAAAPKGATPPHAPR